MRQMHLVVLCSSVVALACNGRPELLPLAPSVVPAAPAAPVTSPTRTRADGPMTIDIDQIVRGRVMPDAPLCDPGGPYPHQCEYYQVIVPDDGVLEVTVRWHPMVTDPYPLDIEVLKANARLSPPVTVGPGTQRRVTVPVKAGEAYVIEIWSFKLPGEEFQMKATLRPV